MKKRRFHSVAFYSNKRRLAASTPLQPPVIGATYFYIYSLLYETKTHAFYNKEIVKIQVYHMTKR